MLMVKWCTFALYNTWKMVSSFSFAENRKKTASTWETSPVGWKARRENAMLTLKWLFPPVTSPLYPQAEQFQRRSWRTDLLLCSGGMLPSTGERIDPRGWNRAGSKKQGKHYISANCCSFQAHFRELLMARTAPFLPSGTQSRHILLVPIGITSLWPAADRETSLSTKKNAIPVETFHLCEVWPKDGRWAAAVGRGYHLVYVFQAVACFRKPYLTLSWRRQKLSSPLHWWQHH